MARKNENKLTAPKKLKALFTIVDRNKCDLYLDLLEGFETNFQIVLYGRGTAPTELANILGFNNPDKAIIISIVEEEKIKEILNQYEDKYFKIKKTSGIAFSVPLSSVIGKIVYQFLTNMEVNNAE